MCEEDHARNPSICTCDCDKNCGTGEYLKDYICTKSLVDDPVVACDEVVNTPEPTSINPNDKTN